MTILTSVLRIVCALALASEIVWAQKPPMVLQTVATGLNSPVFITSARDGSNRKFVIEQSGRILVMQPGSGALTVFLDIRSRVLADGEQGLLGLAFHPQFSSSQRFFVNYVRLDRVTVISEFRLLAGNPNAANPNSETILLEIAQPFSNHKGGMIAFGPDNYLYIATGDGGSGNDPLNLAQNNDQLLGKILRIDVDKPGASTPYSSPASNPFFGPTAGRDEIFATGLRNPWRFSFDRATGQLYVGDVGQNAIEEIDIVTRGGNYGWRILEGTQCTLLDPASCANSGLMPPIVEYSHEGGRCSVTGGYVYRGSQASLPLGAYLFADFCSGEIFMYESGTVTLALDTTFLISSFGEDESGELYVIDLSGAIYRLTQTGSVVTPAVAFSAQDRGGAVYSSSGSATRQETGYARLESFSGAPPTGMAILGFRRDGVTVSETSVPAVSPVSSGRVLATTDGATKTGIAIVNPNATTVTLVFYFTNDAGQIYGAKTTTIPAGGQISRFLHETPFNSGPSLRGTFTFIATQPVAVVALHVTDTPQGPLSSAIAIVSMTSPPEAPLVFPHWAQGAGWSTEFALVNPSNQPLSGLVELRSPNGQTVENLPYSVPPLSSRRISSITNDSFLRTGAARIVPLAGPSPAGVAFFRFVAGDGSITETAVAAIAAGHAFRGYGEIRTSKRTGIAVTNMASSTATVTFEVTPLDGSNPTQIATITLPPLGQRALFLDEIPGLSLPTPFTGMVRTTSTSPIGVTALRARINEQGRFLIAANTPVDESMLPSDGSLFFPFIASGGNYQTEFVLLNAQAGGSQGRLIFFAPTGRFLPLSLRPFAVP